MRAAPAVSVDLPGSYRWEALFALLGAAAAAAAVAALCAHLLPDAMMSGLCIATAAGGGGLLLWRMRPPGRGRLRWDGACWWFRAGHGDAPEQAGHVTVMMDWGRWMLLRFEPAVGGRWRGRVWLPVSEARVLQSAALRAAAYGRGVTELA